VGYIRGHKGNKKQQTCWVGNLNGRAIMKTQNEMGRKMLIRILEKYN